MIRFTVEGREYDYDEDSILVKEARIIKKHTGFGLATMGRGLREGDPDALVAMIFLAKRRAGEAVRWQDLDDLNLGKLAIHTDAAEGDESEDAEGDASDPPNPTGS